MHTLYLCHIGFSYGVSVHRTEAHLVEVDNPQDTEPQGTAENNELIGGWTVYNIKYVIAIEMVDEYLFLFYLLRQATPE